MDLNIFREEGKSGGEVHVELIKYFLETQEQTEHMGWYCELLKCHTQTEIMKEKRVSSSSRSFIHSHTTVAKPLHLISAKKLSECMSTSGLFIP